MGVTLIRRAQLTQQGHIVFRTKAGKGQPQIQTGRLMARRPDDAVTIGPVWIPRIVIRHSQIEGGGNIHDRQRSARVTRSCRMQRDKVITTHQVGCFDQFWDGIVAQCLSSRGVDKSHCSPFLAEKAGPNSNMRYCPRVATP